MTTYFPQQIWPGTSATRLSSEMSLDQPPDGHDWRKIVEELQAVQRGVIGTIESVSSNQVLSDLSQEIFLLVDASSGDLTVQLPNPSLQKFPINIKKIDSSGFTLTVLPLVAEKIDGYDSSIISEQWNSGRYITNGIDWYIV